MLREFLRRGPSPDREGRFLIRGVGATAIVTACSAGLGLVTTAVLARELGAPGFGAYAWALAWVYTLRVPALAGTDRLVTRQVAAYREAGESAEPADAVAWADRSVLRFSISIAVAVGVGALVWHSTR